MRRLLVVACLSLATLADAQSARVPAQYKRLLLPFHLYGSSGAGQWAVSWWFRNDGAEDADAFPLAIQCGLPTPWPSTFILPKPSLPARTTLNCPADDIVPSLLVPPFIPVISSGPGAFLYVERSAQQVTVGGSVYRSWPREPAASATPLEAVPEEAFLSGTRSILPVIIEPDRRYAIRLYALPETIAQSPRVRVRVWDMQPTAFEWPHEELNATFDLELRIPVSSIRPCINQCDVPDLTYVPAVAEAFDLVRPFARKPVRPAFRVEITPESPSLRWWAAVSATDNETHEITIYQPSR